MNGGGRKGRRERIKAEKNGIKGNKSNIELKLSNFRHHRNYYGDFLNKLHLNAAKSTHNQTSSDKAPFNYVLKSILNE